MPINVTLTLIILYMGTYKIGSNDLLELMEFIETIKSAIGKEAEKNIMGMRDGVVFTTYANIDAVGFNPATSLKYGTQNFVDWYRNYYFR